MRDIRFAADAHAIDQSTSEEAMSAWSRALPDAIAGMRTDSYPVMCRL
jgi:hypothetical protein